MRREKKGERSEGEGEWRDVIRERRGEREGERGETREERGARREDKKEGGGERAGAGRFQQILELRFFRRVGLGSRVKGLGFRV